MMAVTGSAPSLEESVRAAPRRVVVGYHHRDESVTAEEAVALVRDGDTLALEAIGDEVDRRLAMIGHKVRVAVDDDNVYLASGLEDAHVAVVRGIAERRYSSVSRYTTSAFMRPELGGNLEHRGLAPYIYESRQEALGNFGERT